jgi:hypothetical protein
MDSFSVFFPKKTGVVCSNMQRPNNNGWLQQFDDLLPQPAWIIPMSVNR